MDDTTTTSTTTAPADTTQSTTSTPADTTTTPATTTTAETKPATETSLTDKPADTTSEKKTDTTTADAPTINFESLKIPEGVKLEGEVKDAFAAALTDADPNKRAQAALDLFHSEIKKVSEAPLKTWTETQNKWVEQVKADKEIGGENWAATSTTIAKALDTFGTPGVRAALNLTGAGNNPEVIRTIFNMAKALTEGQHVSGGPSSKPADQMTLAEKMYPQAQGA